MESPTQEQSKPIRNYVIDFETLGLTPDSVVLSVGIVCLEDPEDSMYAEASPINQNDRRIDESTFLWWQEQKKAGIHYPSTTNTLFDLTNTAAAYFDGISLDYEIQLWSQGTDFDIPIIYNLYRQWKFTPQWKYINVADIRTLRKMFPEIKGDDSAYGQYHKHHALGDALYEAELLRRLLTRIELLHKTFLDNNPDYAGG